MAKNTNFNKENVLKQAALYYREGQWDKALEEQGRILSMDRNDADALAAVGDIYTRKKSYQLAYEFFFKSIPYFLLQGRVNLATLAFKKIIRLDMEKLFGIKVFLQLWVKTQRGWPDDNAQLTRQGI